MPHATPGRTRATLLLLWGVALVLLLAGLGSVPLRDWDEGIVARVALETSWRSGGDRLLPTFWGVPYLNKPPGLHGLIAAAIEGWRSFTGRSPDALPPEWVVRLVPALLSSLVVPLVALVQLRLRPSDRGSVLATGVIALTLLPLARHGRLAMLDGTQLSAALSLWLGLLLTDHRDRSPWGGALLAGLAGSALLLLKAPVLLPVLLGGLLLRGLDRELPPRAWGLLLAGIAIGLIPGLAWHGWHWLQRGDPALLMWGRQGLLRVTTTVEEHHGNPLLPLLEMLEGGWPWLPLWPLGLLRAWRERRTRAGRWGLGLTLITALMVLPIRTQLPWYSLLLWPPFCLVCGPVLADLVRRPPRQGVLRFVPRFWSAVGVLLLLAVVVASLPFHALPAELVVHRFIPVPAALGLLLGGTLLAAARLSLRRLGLAVLTAGWCLSLLVFLCSPLWNWELNETWSVAPVVELIRENPAADPASPLPVYMVGDDAERPSLRWYSRTLIRRLPLLPTGELPPRYVLIQRHAAAAAVDGDRRLGNGSVCRRAAAGREGWQRWLCTAPAEEDRGEG